MIRVHEWRHGSVVVWPIYSQKDGERGETCDVWKFGGKEGPVGMERKHLGLCRLLGRD
jgi:hypothetical protein